MNIVSEHEDLVYNVLRNKINKTPVGYPKTESGVELKILKYLFTPKEAEVALSLGSFPKPLGLIFKIRKDKKLTKFELEEHLESMANKGAIIGAKFRGKEYIGVIRSTFLINPEGKIVHIWPKVSVKGHPEDVQRVLTEITK